MSESAGQDKGPRSYAAAFVRAVEHGGEAPISCGELVDIAGYTTTLVESLRT